MASLQSLWHSPLLYKVRGAAFHLYETLTDYSLERAKFKKRTGYNLDLKNPKSFNQKICYRKIFHHNPKFSIAADKYKVRDYIKELLGNEAGEHILVKLLYVTDDPKTIPFESLPEEYVIKATHGSGTNIIIEKDGTVINPQEVIETCKKWLRHPYGLLKHEWAYSNIDRKIIVEELLRDRDGQLPMDYKFHMFHGNCEMIQVNQGHFADKEGRRLTIFDADWNKQDVFWEFQAADYVERPANLERMLDIAKKLSRDFDYVRVDLYSVNDRIYFGEFTFYPTTGQAYVKPSEFDFQLGSKWNILTRQEA